MTDLQKRAREIAAGLAHDESLAWPYWAREGGGDCRSKASRDAAVRWVARGMLHAVTLNVTDLGRAVAAVLAEEVGL